MHVRPLFLALSMSAALPGCARESVALRNPAIDMPGYVDVSERAARHREPRRLTEDEFLRMAAEPGTVVLDARSRERYEELHIRGAINLSFPDITIASLEQALPDKDVRILIYCNNNFLNANAFPSKRAEAALNLSTYIALYSHGYRNVYELGPLLDARTTRLALVGTDAPLR